MLSDLQQVNDLKARVDSILATIRAEQIKKRAWEVERRKLLLGVDNRRELTGILLQVVELYKELGGENEQQVLERVQDFVSYGLSAVFGDNYQFITKMRTEGKELKVDFGIRTDGLQTGVVGAKGGGLAEVVSILIQLFFVLVDKSLSRFVVLDAALIHLSEKYWKNMSQLLAEICNKSDIQILLMAHTGDYGAYADVLYEFTQKEGKTKARRIK
jgi:hypothetical protein